MDWYMMNCELLATCSALGYLEGDVYHREPDCLESVKDLIRYLRHEDETRDVRQQLGAAQILQNDLLPILVQYPQEKVLFDAVIRLMVNLTQPALLCFGKVPADATSRHHFLQVLSYLQAYKEAFANEKVFGVLSEKLYNLLQLDWEQRQEEDALLIERILLLVRNVLHVPPDPTEEQGVDGDASVHDRVLWALHISGMDDLLKFLASAQVEQQWALHVLEIISLMFREQSPEELAAMGQGTAGAEHGEDTRELQSLRQREMAEKRSRALQRTSRHSRFGGSYVLQGVKSIGDRDVVFHKGLHNLKSYSHDLGKEPRRLPRRRQPAPEAEPSRRSARNVRLFLRRFCQDFLQDCYNRLMLLVKDQLVREKAQEHDETYYLWATSFFMAFNRLQGFRPELVSETVGVRAFHFIEQNLTTYYEMALMDKKEATTWARRMHLALKAYQELLRTLQEMDRYPEQAVRDSSQVIKSNIFYLMEYRELFLTLFRKFDETKQPRSFLKDLVETAHLFLRMLERFCRGRANLVVQSKRVRRKKKKPHVPAVPAPPSAEELEQLWEGLAPQVQACLEGEVPLPEDVVPFDATSETPVEEQRAEALLRIQECLRDSRVPQALQLLRSAREVWPEGDVFGSADVGPEEETRLLREILVAALPRHTPTEPEEPEEEEEEDEEEEEQTMQVSEKEFNFLDYLKRFACAPVVRALVLLLRGYARNSARTNHCAARLLHRLARDLHMEPLLFQLSLFALFHRLLSDPAAAAHQELVTLAKFILGKFFALAATNKKAFVELLFWKSPAVVGEMTQGYSSLQEGEGTTRSRVPPWTPQEEQELRELYWKYKEMEGEDIIAAILAQLPSPGRTRRQVVKQLVRMGLASSAKDFPRERKGTRIVLWTQEQEEELTRLFEEFQGSDDVLGNIMKHLTARRSRARVVEKLLGLGLVAERKELYKKRRRKSQGHGPGQAAPGVPAMPAQDSSGEDEDSEEEAEEDEDDEGLTEERWVPEEGAGQDLVQHLHQEGLAGPLRWLQNCLRRAAEDREEDGVSHPVPLVPLTEENEDAMEDRRFRNLLRQLGLRPPASEQESFWRIPAALTPQQLRRAAASIAHSDPPGSPQNLPEPPRCPQDGAAEPLMAALGSDSESEEPVPVPVPSPVLARTKRRRELTSEDEDEDGGSSGTEPPPPDPRSEEDEDEDEEDPQPRGRRKRIRCLEEEED